MKHSTAPRYRRWLIPVLVPAFVLLGTILASAQGVPVIGQVDQAVGATGQGQATTASASPGTKVTAPLTATGPTAAQLQEAAALTARSNRTGPPGSTASSAAPGSAGPATQAPAKLPAAPTSFTIFRNSTIPSSGIAGGYAYSSFVGEPSTAVNGKHIFQTGNWYATVSHNNGATWTSLNPFTLFGSGFCCDQVTVYDPGRNRVFWELQYNNHLVLANADGSIPGGWCYYTITPSWFGQPSNYEIDYNDLALGTNFLYLVSNIYNSTGGFAGSGVVRIPIDAMVGCSTVNYNYFVRSDSSTLKPVQGATDVMYLGSNWGQTNGSSFRIYSWAENSGTFYWYDRTIASFSFEYRNSGQNCGSRDGVVKNWCQFLDSRVRGGYLAKGVLGFSFDAKQDSTFPFPYSRRVYFRESDKAYLSSSSFWGSWGAIQYLTLAPNARGHIGGAFAFGGGTGTTHFYPSAGVLIDDDVSPSQPWSYNYYLAGSFNTCQDTQNNNYYRWGDYLTVRQDSPAGDAWAATGYAIKGATCGTSGWFAEPHNTVFGRSRDMGSYTRWNNS